MKKVYLLALSILWSAALFAQSGSALRVTDRLTSREKTSARTPNRVDAILHGGMRDVILEENFQTSGAVPGDLPAGWLTIEVSQSEGTETTSDDTFGPAFKIHNSTTANAGSYWPVPEVGTGNRFAGANDDNEPCDCDMEDVYIQTPLIDLSTATYPALTFDFYHDGNFGSGDASVEFSIDGGDSWTMYEVPGEENGFLPIEEGFWQTIVIPLYEYVGVTGFSIRFNWTDVTTGSNWASGFAIDNVVLGDLETNSLTLGKVVFGDWNQDNFGLGFWDYTQIPLNQVDTIRSTATVYNTGFNDLTNVGVNFEVFHNSASQGVWSSLEVETLESLTKDSLSIVTDFVPDALGEYSIVALAYSDSLEADETDNIDDAVFNVTECTYARDLGYAQGFWTLADGDWVGNLFDIYQEADFTSVKVALNFESTPGATISATLYEFGGYNPTTGNPVLTYVEDSATDEVTIYEDDLNVVGGSTFICLPFSDPLTLQANKTYLVTVTPTDSVRVGISGTNNGWAISMYYDDSTTPVGTTFRTGSPYMIRLMGDCSDGCTVGVEENEKENTLSAQAMPNPASNSTIINYTLDGSSNVYLTLHDVTGKLVESYNLGNRPSGRNNHELNVSTYAPGIYTYTISAGELNSTNKLIVE